MSEQETTYELSRVLYAIGMHTIIGANVVPE